MGMLDFLFRRMFPGSSAPPAPAPEPAPPSIVEAFPRLITFAAMRAAAPEATPAMIDVYVEPLDAACREFAIVTPKRVAAFLAQVAHETGGFRWDSEIASGAAYEGRADLGNTEPGDGALFKGRGLIQLTGRRNYRLASQALFGDDRLILAPQLAGRADISARVAAWYWATNGCNELADDDDFERITRRINGGVRGFPDRVARWSAVRREMGTA